MTKKRSPFGDRARSIELLWQLDPARGRPSRGPKPGLRADRIAEAGIAIADAEGLAAVSMQRVAATFVLRRCRFTGTSRARRSSSI